ncbi:MAG: flagellar hook-basal body complex protein [Candidatus Acidulodesulfobacterium ferriphilum]|uniref:Flagellar hook protein FlgE n=1 Tax=Candidatus Acidulodesulfobacterium ferriphilum TaxID=2597223 RepID=A0A519BB61_9DELT|nr:MAG: flagellar hook-basal body complex protein [Candidatus Acidulodesulfobacterium ferriphilum]
MGANALFTAVSGLNANQTYLGVIGNNIANSNTIGFKSSDPIFQNLVSQTLSGVSSSQEGLGTSVYSIQQQFGQGALETTSNPLNMAVDGSGFFIVQSPNGSTYYTRNGQFSENAQGQIVDSTGQNIVQGYPLNAQGISTSGTPQPISLTTSAIPPLATTTATLTANLDSNISPQTTPTTTTGTFMGGYLTSSASAGSSTVNVDMTYKGATGSAPTSLLIGNGDGTTNLYTVTSYVSGGVTYTPATLPSGSAVTSVTLSSPLTSSVLQNTAISQNTLGLTSTSGVLQGSDMQINTNGNSTSSDPYQFLNTVASVNSNSTVNLSNAMPVPSGGSFTAGGGVIAGPASDYYSTTINVYDSLGNSLPMTVTFAPTSSSAGNWNVYYTINGTAAQRSSFSTITPTSAPNYDVQFNSNGQIVSGTTQTLTDVPAYVNPAPATLQDGASEPLNVALNLNNLTQYAATSATTAFTQNGYSTGTLTSFTVDQNGRISGLFSNGQTKYLYQVALANFIAPTGLVSEGNSLYAQSFQSGQPAVGVANSGNFGYITDSALEQSNVNISSEFTNMIIAQNAYVANSKVLTTENAVLTALETAIP